MGLFSTENKTLIRQCFGELQLYCDLISQPSRALYIILKASGTQFKECPVDLLEDEQLDDDFKRRINRFQKVPAIIDGNFKLAESVAILRYLTAKHLIFPHFYPSDLKQRARIDEFLSWEQNGVRTSCSMYFRSTWLHVRRTAKQGAPEKIVKYKQHMERDLEIIETLLQNQPYLTGDNLTAADVFCACDLEQLRMTGYDELEKFPKIFNWLQLVRHQLQPHYDIAHQRIYQYEKERLGVV